MLFSASLLCLLVGISVPPMMAAAARSRGLAAVRYLAARMAAARVQAVARTRNVAVYFEQDTRGLWISTVQDGNGNGVLARDIADLIDPVLEPRALLSDLFPGVTAAVADGVTATQPVQLSGTSILSFTPAGTATSGSIFVLGPDGTQWSVRILGVTGRVRVLRYVPASGEWVTAG